MESESRPSRFVERIFRLRALGLGLGFFVVAGVLHENGAEPWVWALLVVDGFLWPHLARRLALGSSDPERAEIRNLLIDSAMGGVWIALMRFNLLPSAVLVVMLAIDKINVGGWRLLLRAFALQVVACAIAATTTGFAVDLPSSMGEILLSLPFLLGYPLAISTATFLLARRATHHNRMLASQMRVDAATGLLNRSSWEAVVDSELRRFRRGGAAVALLMIDIDHFKEINDRLGHLAGDEVIATIASVIQSCIREVDVASRYGGDEFGVILAHTGTHAALAAAERIRQRVVETRFERSPDLSCTLSIGIAQATRAMEDRHAWISQADAALYRAKSAGRNQTARA
jgi:diguanylate cyclase